MHITEDILQIVFQHPSSRGMNANAYLITEEKPCLIDTGFGDPNSTSTIVEAFSQAKVSLENLALVIGTHAHMDHIGGIPSLKLLSNAKIAMHKLEDTRMRNLQLKGTLEQIKTDRFLEDDETVDLGKIKLQVILTPGHTSGHICLYEQERGILFSGDHIISGTPDGTVYIGPPDGDVSQYMASLNKFLKLELKMILPGHGQIIYDPREKINSILKHHLEREKQIISILESGEKTVEQIAKIIYDRVDSTTAGAVIGRLKKLVNDGSIEVVRKDHLNLYRVRK